MPQATKRRSDLLRIPRLVDQSSSYPIRQRPRRLRTEARPQRLDHAHEGLTLQGPLQKTRFSYAHTPVVQGVNVQAPPVFRIVRTADQPRIKAFTWAATERASP